jgi:acetyl esterase/lipase
MAYLLTVCHPEVFHSTIIMSGPLALEFLVRGETASEFRAALNAGPLPPFFAFHGTKASLAPPSNARRAVEAIRKISPAIKLKEVPGGHHVFDQVEADIFKMTTT